MTLRSVVIESLNNLRATPIRAALLLLTLVGCLSGPGLVAARFSSNAWRNEESAIRHGAYIYVAESRDPAADGGRRGIAGGECERLAHLSSITHAGAISTLEDARIGSHPDGGIEAVAATPGIFGMLSEGHSEGYVGVGHDASRELGVAQGDRLAVNGFSNRVSILSDIAGRTDYFARTVLVPALRDSVRGKCIVEMDRKDLDYADGVIQAMAGPREWRVSKYSEYLGYVAADVISRRSGLPLAGLCFAAFSVVMSLFLTLRKGAVAAYYVSGASRAGVCSILLFELYVLAAIAIPAATTATLVGGRMNMRDARVGFEDLSLVAAGVLALSAGLIYVLIGSPARVFETARKAE